MPKKINLLNNLGFMQGRLSKNTAKRLQSFPWGNWINEFKIANKLKFRLIEWTLDYYNILNNPLFIKRNKIINLSRKYNLKINSITCDFFMQRFFINYNNTHKINFIFDLLFDVSIDLKIKYIVVPLIDQSRVKNKNDLNQVKAFFKSIDEKYSNNKFTEILFETDFDPSRQLSFIKSFSSKRFGINYDTGNSAHSGFDFKQEFAKYGNFIKNIHIKDRKFKGESVRLGNGSFDFNTFFRLLAQNKYQGNLILQTAKSTDYISELNINRNFIYQTCI